MSSKYYDLCNRHRGRAVEIRTRDGGVHRGIIDKVDGNRVFIRPMRRRNLGGFGYGLFGGYGYGGYGGFGGYGWGGGYSPYGIALGAIVGLSLLSLFFW